MPKIDSIFGVTIVVHSVHMRRTRGRRDVDKDDDSSSSPSSLLPAGKRRRTSAVAADDPASPSDGGSRVCTHGAPRPHGEPAAPQQPEAEGEREAGDDLSAPPDGVDLEAAIVALLRKRGPGKTC